MTNVDWLVIGGGVGLIIAIAYYFFGPKKGVKVEGQDGEQKVEILVEGAYDPAVVEVKVNKLVEVVFDRRDKGDCTEWVIFDKLPTKEKREVKARLPEGKRTVVRFTPTKVGTYSFTCGMGMVRGKLVVKK